MIELIVLLIGISVLFGWIYYNDTTTKEGFDSQYYLQSCPSGYNTFYYRDSGNVGCCNGAVKDNVCSSGMQCTLNESKDASIPNCVTMLLKQYSEKGPDKCPPSMPSYFEDLGEKRMGCTAGNLNQTMNAPQAPSQAVCKIYSDFQDNLFNTDSCANQKELEAYPCFGLNCQKSLVKPSKTGPVVVQVTFMDAAGMFHTSYTRASYERFLNFTNPHWRDQGIDLNKNVIVAEVAKAYFADKSIGVRDVQL